MLVVVIVVLFSLTLVASIKWKSHSKWSNSHFGLVHFLGFQSILRLSVNDDWIYPWYIKGWKKNLRRKCVEFYTLCKLLIYVCVRSNISRAEEQEKRSEIPKCYIVSCIFEKAGQFDSYSVMPKWEIWGLSNNNTTKWNLIELVFGKCIYIDIYKMQFVFEACT